MPKISSHVRKWLLNTVAVVAPMEKTEDSCVYVGRPEYHFPVSVAGRPMFLE